MKETKDFWNKRAYEVIDELSVTDNDIYRRILETRTLVELLPENMSIIDIGCGTGWGTREFSKVASSIVGSDFSEEMISIAKSKGGNVLYEVDDIRTSETHFDQFDVAISQRCIINILDEEQQYNAIKNIHAKLVKNGIYLMLEGSRNGREALNVAREFAGLERMPIVEFNRDFEENKLQKFLDDLFIIEQKIYFGLYDYLSRVIYPLAVFPTSPQYKSKLNKYGSELEINDQFKELSRTFLYVLRKR